MKIIILPGARPWGMAFYPYLAQTSHKPQLLQLLPHVLWQPLPRRTNLIMPVGACRQLPAVLCPLLSGPLKARPVPSAPECQDAVQSTDIMPSIAMYLVSLTAISIRHEHISSPVQSLLNWAAAPDLHFCISTNSPTSKGLPDTNSFVFLYF